MKPKPRLRPAPAAIPTKDVTLPLDQLIVALKEIETILQSLHRVGSFYDDRAECDQETIRILDAYRCLQRLSRARSILTNAIRQNVSQAEIETIEETLCRVKHWRKPIRKDVRQ